MTEGIPEEICQQLGTVDRSIFFLVLIVAAVLISLHAVVLQRGLLVCSALEPARAAEETPCTRKKIFTLKLGASFMTLLALIYFFGLSEEALAQTVQACSPVATISAKRNVNASLLVLAAAAVRFYDLLYVENATSSAQWAQMLEEETGGASAGNDQYFPAPAENAESPEDGAYGIGSERSSADRTVSTSSTGLS